MNERSGVSKKRVRKRRFRFETARESGRGSRWRTWARGLFLVGVMAATIIPVLFVSDVISYLPLVTVVLFAVFDIVYLFALKRNLVLRIESVAGGDSLVCERGEQAGLSIELENSGALVYPRVEATFFVTDLFGDYAARTMHSTTIMPHATRTIPMDVRFRHLGRYSTGVSEVRMYDLIGFLSRSLDRPLERTVTVTPHLFDIERVSLSNASPTESASATKPLVTDDLDYAGVREYRFGDPLKTVHWKLSSRMPGQELYTRLFEVYGNPGLETIVDSTAPDYSTEDLMTVFDGLMESALSINLYAREQGMDAEVAFINRDGAPANTQIADAEHADSLVEAIKRVESVDAASDPDAALRLLQDEGMSGRGMANLAYCTARLTPQTVQALVSIRARRRHPILFLVVPRSLEGDERDKFLAPLRQLDSSNIPYYLVESVDDAIEVSGV